MVIYIHFVNKTVEIEFQINFLDDISIFRYDNNFIIIYLIQTLYVYVHLVRYTHAFILHSRDYVKNIIVILLFWAI